MLELHLKHSEEFQKDGTHSEVFDKLGNGLVLIKIKEVWYQE